MTIVITGATGMIGTHLRASLAAAGRPVRVLSHGAAGMVPAGEVRALPAPDAPLSSFQAALAGASHVIHCAALNSDSGTSSEDAFFSVNATLTGKLASAASRMLPGRFLYLSSIRAMADAGETAELDEKSPCRPTQPYGRSKLEGERLLGSAYETAGRDDAVSLRLPPVYGAGMRGQLGALLRLADTPLPLPLKAYGTPRTLVSCRSVVQAILLLLDHTGPIDRTYLAGDRESIRVGEILSAFRRGLRRPDRLFPVPETLLRGAAAMALQGNAARLLAAGQTVRSDRLIGLGWTPEPDTGAALARTAAAVRAS